MYPVEMSNIFRYAAVIPGAVAGLFVSAFAGDISSRIMSRLIDSLLGFRSNRAPLLTARSLEITHSSKPEYWTWVRQTDSRFTEVAELLKVWWLDITARIKFGEILPETNYAAHLIFKITPNSSGLDTFQEAFVSVGSLQWKKVVCLKPRLARSSNKCIGWPVERSDGWMELELELGQFYCDNGTGTGNQEVVVSLKDTDDDNKKCGLIVAGIELRPF